MAAEVVTGIIANSLALLSDAAHMLTDAAAIGFSLVAINLAQRPAEGQMTFGLKRAEILSAQANGITLLVLAAIIAIEAVRRLVSPPEVEAALILVVALAGIVVNLAATATLARANRQSLNVEGSFQHILTDLFAFVGTAIAATVILLTSFDQADAIASLLVAGLMLRSAVGLLRDSGRIFLEAAPKQIDPQEIGRRMAAQPGVVEVHDLHVWEVTSEFPALSAHVTVERRRRLPPRPARARRADRAPVRHPPHHPAGRTRARTPRPDRELTADGTISHHIGGFSARRPVSQTPRASRGRGSRRAASWRR